MKVKVNMKTLGIVDETDVPREALVSVIREDYLKVHNEE